MDLEQVETISLQQAISIYPDQWLGVKVIERDTESGQPVKVQMIAKNMDLNVIRRMVKMDGICTFYTGQIPQETVVLMF